MPFGTGSAARAALSRADSESSLSLSALLPRLSKISFCGIKFSISESLYVTQVAVHTDGAPGAKATVARPVRVEL